MDQPKQTIRPTKKQQELLSYIESFIAEHGYSPSYREIKNGMGYNSIATISLHINSLITRGHLRKRDNAARSLELVAQPEQPKLKTNQIKPGEEKWLIEKIEYLMHQAESVSTPQQAQIDGLQTLVDALYVLGLDGAASSFTSRLSKLKDTSSQQE